MSCTPEFPYTLEVVLGRAVSHLSSGDDWDALALSPELLPFMTPELPVQIPDHDLFIPIDLEPLSPPIMNILNLQEREDTDFEGAGLLPPPSIHSPDSQESEDANFQAMRALPSPDIHTPDLEGAEEAGIQAGEFLQSPNVQTPSSEETEDADFQEARRLPLPSLNYPESQGTEEADFQEMRHLPPSDVYIPDSQETEDADFEAAGPLPPLEPSPRQTYIYVSHSGSLAEFPIDPQVSETEEYTDISISTGILGSQDISSDLERFASQETEFESNNLAVPERLHSEDTENNPSAPAITGPMRPRRYPGKAFPDLPGKKLPFEERAKLHTDKTLLELLSLAWQKKTNLVIGTNNISSSERVLELAEEIGPHIAMLRLMPKPMKVLEDDAKGLRLFQRKLREISHRHKFIVLSCREIGWGRKENAYILSDKCIENMGAQGTFNWALLEPKAEIESDARPGFGFLVLTQKKEVVVINLEQGEIPEGQGQSIGFEVTIKDDKPKRPSPNQKYRDIVWDDKGCLRHIETNTPTATSYPIYMPSNKNKVDEFEDSFITFHMKVNCLAGDSKIGYTPTRAISTGADFFIVQEEICDAGDPAEMAKKYQEEGWKAYLAKTQPQTRSAGPSNRPSD